MPSWTYADSTAAPTRRVAPAAFDQSAARAASATHHVRVVVGGRQLCAELRQLLAHAACLHGLQIGRGTERESGGHREHPGAQVGKVRNVGADLGRVVDVEVDQVPHRGRGAGARPLDRNQPALRLRRSLRDPPARRPRRHHGQPRHVPDAAPSSQVPSRGPAQRWHRRGGPGRVRRPVRRGPWTRLGNGRTTGP